MAYLFRSPDSELSSEFFDNTCTYEIVQTDEVSQIAAFPSSSLIMVVFVGGLDEDGCMRVADGFFSLFAVLSVKSRVTTRLYRYARRSALSLRDTRLRARLLH